MAGIAKYCFFGARPWVAVNRTGHAFLFSRTFASSQNLWSAAVGLSSFKGEYFDLFEPQMAAAVVFAMPMVVLFLVLQRRFVAGGLAGAVK